MFLAVISRSGVLPMPAFPQTRSVWAGDFTVRLGWDSKDWLWSENPQGWALRQGICASSGLVSGIARAELAFDVHARAMAIRVFAAAGTTVYYHQTPSGDLLLSSHVACLRRSGVPIEENTALLPEFFAYRCVLAPATLFRNIQRVPYGGELVLTFESSRPSISVKTMVDRLGSGERNRELPAAYAGDMVDILREAIRPLVPIRDRVAMLLSGGIDSSVLCRLASDELGAHRSSSASYPFEDPDLDVERSNAVAAAAVMKFDHEHYETSTARYMAGLVEAIAALESPVHHLQSVCLYLLQKDGIDPSKTVVMQGLGAGGVVGNFRNFLYLRNKAWASVAAAAPFYNMLKQVPLLTGRGATFLGRLSDLRNRSPLEDPENPIWAWHRHGDVSWICSRFHVSPSDIITRHVDCVRGLGAASICEIWARYALTGDEEATLAIFSMLSTATGRVGVFPDYDRKLLAYADAIPWSVKMASPENSVRKAMARAVGVPESVLNRRKAGFGIRRDDWALEGGPFDPVASLAEKVVGRSELRAVRSRDRGKAMIFWNLVNYAIWKRICINGESSAALAEEAAGMSVASCQLSVDRKRAEQKAESIPDSEQRAKELDKAGCCERTRAEGTERDVILPPASVVAVVQDRATYCMTPPYDPSEVYPEYPFKTRSACVVDNPAYRAVRQAFVELALDATRYGTAEWNPLHDIVPAGGTVVIKPNLVIDKHYGGGDIYSIITHPSVIRAVADYCRIALGSTGHIIVADAPVEDCDFKNLLEVTGLDKIAVMFREAGGVSLEIRDLRRFQSPPGERAYSFKRVSLPGDPLGDVVFDLGEQSALTGKSGPFYGADPATRETAGNHHGSVHRYCVSKTVLSCDVLISVPKLKVHRKVGVTLNLKGLVGINTNKNYLVHYTMGTPRSGGDETPDFSSLSDSAVLKARRLIRKTFFDRRSPLMEQIHHALFHSAIYVSARSLLRRLGLRQSSQSSASDGGNWHGNDSCWRMVADITQIAFYGDTKGRLCGTPQRRMFSVVDGIVGGDRNGPLQPRARQGGVVIAGADPGAVDMVSTRVMGFDPLRLPLYRWLMAGPDRLICPSIEDVRVVGNEVAIKSRILEQERGLGFEPHENWTGHLEAGSRTAGRSLRVCQVAANLETGGMERVVCDLLEGLGKAGHDPYLFCTDGRGAFFDDAVAVGKQSSVRRPKPWIVDFGVVAALSEFIRQHNIDVVHAHNQLAQLYGVLAARRTGKPVVTTFHGQGFYDTARVIYLRRLLCRFTRRVVTVSRDSRQVLANKRISDIGRIRVIPNGVDTGKFSPESVANRPDQPCEGSAVLPFGAFVVGSVGRLGKEKNYPMLVRAFARMVKNVSKAGPANTGSQTLSTECGESCPDAGQLPSSLRPKFYGPLSHLVLLIVGDGPDRDRIEKAIDEAGIRDHVVLAGLQKDVAWWLRRMHIFCLASDTEGMPITLLEAGATGLPSVATDAGGNTEVVDDGVTGLIVPRGDEVGFAEALQKLVEDDELRRRLGQAAMTRIRERYSLESMVEQYVRVYKETIGRRL